MRHGDLEEGFEIDVKPDERLLSLRIWGYWKHEELRETYRREMQRAFEALSETQWALLADFTDSVTQRPEVYELHREVFVAAHERGLTRIAAVASNALVRLQLNRLTLHVDEGIWSFHENATEALDTLKVGGRSPRPARAT